MAAAEAQNFKPPDFKRGVVVEKVGEGIVRITQKGQPGMIMLDKNGWRALLPAGNGMRVVGQGPWSSGAVPSAGGGAAGLMGGRGGPRLLRGPRQTIMEPYIGPSVESPFHLMSRHPGSRVIATEGLLPPSPANIGRLQRAGGVFLAENQPVGIFSSTLDKTYVRFPLPHSTAVRGTGPRIMSVFDDLRAANSGVRSDLLMEQAVLRATGSAETLTNFAPYALQRLKPGGTLEVVFWECSIQSEVNSVLRQVHIEPGQGAFKFELVGQTRTTRGAVAPHSGIPNVSMNTPVYKAVLRKVPITKGLLPPRTTAHSLAKSTNN